MNERPSQPKALLSSKKRAKPIVSCLACQVIIMKLSSIYEKKEKIFDAWSVKYDEMLAAKKAPISFESYDEVLLAVLEQARVKEGMKVLDIGTGTGNLAALFLSAKCVVWGMDFSTEMIAIAKKKLHTLRTVQANIAEDKWPKELNQRFDRIVSSYVLHDFTLAMKRQLIERLVRDYLSENGLIVIADISYPTEIARSKAQTYWGCLWNTDEYYWAADETNSACQSMGLECTYHQVSSCAGVYVIG
jgi:putative AdoMet-dependent methyltransferase